MRIYDEAFARIQPRAAQPLSAHVNPIRSITIPLDTALDLKDFNIQGSVLFAVKASSKTATMTVRFNDQMGEGVPFSEGLLIGGILYNKIYVTATAQAGEWITLLYLVEDQNFRALNPSSQFSSVAVSKAANYSDSADVTLANGVESIVLAADATRRTAHITADAANTVTIRIGQTGTVGAARGTPLRAGETFTLDTTDTIYGFAGAAGQKVAISWTAD